MSSDRDVPVAANSEETQDPVETPDPGQTSAETTATEMLEAGTTAPDLTAAPASEAAAEVRELVAQSLGQYLKAWWLKVRSGDSGVLPVLLAMVVVAVVFQIITPQHAFLRPSNLVYIFGLSTVYMILAIAETVVLLLAEVDLSTGAVALIGGVIAFKLVQQGPGPNWPWWLAILAALVICGAIGALQGALIVAIVSGTFLSEQLAAPFWLLGGLSVVLARAGIDAWGSQPDAGAQAQGARALPASLA